MSREQEKVFLERMTKNMAILHKVCNVYCNNEEEKRDMMQEITLQLWKAFPSFREQSKFSTWMYRIAFNTAVTNIRRSKRHPILEAFSDKQEEPPDKEDIPSLDDEINRLYKAISHLNEIEKGIILLYLEKRSYAEIGEITGLSEKNVSVKIVRIKVKLKKIMS